MLSRCNGRMLSEQKGLPLEWLSVSIKKKDIIKVIFLISLILILLMAGKILEAVVTGAYSSEFRHVPSTILELTGAVIAFAAFSTVWHSNKQCGDVPKLLLGISMMIVGVTDFLFVITERTFPQIEFWGVFSNNTALPYVSQALHGALILSGALVNRNIQQVNRWLVLFFGMLALALVFILGHLNNSIISYLSVYKVNNWFPKIYFLSAILFLSSSLFIYLYRYKTTRERTTLIIVIAIFIGILAQSDFLLMNWLTSGNLGHSFQNISFLLFYWALIVSGIQLPYKELLKIREKLKRSVEGIDIGVLAIKPSGKITLFNRSMEMITGENREDIYGRNFLDVFSSWGQLGNGLSLRLSETIKMGILHEDERLKCDDGREFLLSTNAVYDNDRVDEVIVAIKEVTKQREMEKAILSAEKMVLASNLAAVAAHEIRNPLTSIRGFLQLLEKDMDTVGKKGYVEIMVGEIDRIDQIIEDFLQLSEPTRGKHETIDITQVIENVGMELEDNLSSTNVHFETRVKQGIPPINGDYKQLTQLLSNISKNALDAMPHGGKLLIEVDFSFDQVAISIIDNGTGMDDKTKAKMFEPFFTTKVKGTGLGLAVCSQIAEYHCGQIEVETTVGRGTKVHVKLPRYELIDKEQAS